jgi:hypothetical protein
MVARNRVGIGLSYRPARLHRLGKLIPWNRFLGSSKVLNSGFDKLREERVRDKYECVRTFHVLAT